MSKKEKLEKIRKELEWADRELREKGELKFFVSKRKLAPGANFMIKMPKKRQREKG